MKGIPGASGDGGSITQGGGVVVGRMDLSSRSVRPTDSFGYGDGKEEEERLGKTK